MDRIEGRTLVLALRRRIRTGKAAGMAAVLLAALVFGGCASPVFSKKEVTWADREILFRDVEHHPRSLEGQHVVLGGLILSVKEKGYVGTIAVKEFPLSKDFRPETIQPSLGVFEIRTEEPLPANRYQAGREVEVIGKIVPPVYMKTPDGKMKLVPVVTARNLHVQEPPPPPEDDMSPFYDDPDMMMPGMMYPGFFPGFFP
jgi:outer membrane lipoprotein